MTTMALSQAQIESLLMAVLAVNKFPLERAWPLLPAMRAVGLTQPSRVMAMSLEETIEALTRSGYDRKNLTWLFAERVISLMAAIHNGELAGLEQAIASHDKSRASELLERVRGVGPTVVDNAWALLLS